MAQAAQLIIRQHYMPDLNSRQLVRELEVEGPSTQSTALSANEVTPCLCRLTFGPGTGRRSPNFSELTGVRTGEMVMLDIGCDTALAGLHRVAPRLKTRSTVIKDMDVNSGLVTGGPLSGAAIGLVAADLVLLNARHITGVAPVPHSLRFDDCARLKELFQNGPPLPAFTEVALDRGSAYTYTTAELLSLLSKAAAGATALEGLTFPLPQLPDLKLLRVMICESVSKESVLPMNSLMPSVMDTIGRLVTLEFEPAVVFEAAGPNA
ncbi:MAG: hypothetical protein WDW36_001452 [Sanguina aurantia]